MIQIHRKDFKSRVVNIAGELQSTDITRVKKSKSKEVNVYVHNKELRCREVIDLS